MGWLRRWAYTWPGLERAPLWSVVTCNRSEVRHAGLLMCGGALQAMYKSYGTCRELMELRNLTTVGEIILMSALQRKGSCGGHYCLDDPARPVRIPCTTYPYHSLWPKLQHCLDDSVMLARTPSFTACACHLETRFTFSLGPWYQVRVAGLFWSSKCIPVLVLRSLVHGGAGSGRAKDNHHQLCAKEAAKGVCQARG